MKLNVVLNKTIQRRKKKPYIKARHGQVSSLQICAAQVTVAQVGSSQVCHLKIYVAQIQAGQVSTIEVKTLMGDKYSAIVNIPMDKVGCVDLFCLSNNFLNIVVMNAIQNLQNFQYRCLFALILNMSLQLQRLGRNLNLNV